MYSVNVDADTQQAVKSSEIIGFYVSPEVWSRLALPAVRTSAGCRVGGTAQDSPVPVGPVQCTSCLAVLAALVRGAKREAVQPYLQVHTHLNHRATLHGELYCAWWGVVSTGTHPPAWSVLCLVGRGVYTCHLRISVYRNMLGEEFACLCGHTPLVASSLDFWREKK